MELDKRVQIVPITWMHNEKILKEPARLFEYSLPTQVMVHVHEAIHPVGNSDEDLVTLRKKVFATINSALPPQYRNENEN